MLEVSIVKKLSKYANTSYMYVRTQNIFIQKLLIKISKTWKEANVSNLNGEDDEQMKNMEEDFHLLRGIKNCHIKNNPLFTSKNDKEIKFKKQKYSQFYFVLQNNKTDSRLKSTKFIQKLIKKVSR